MAAAGPFNVAPDLGLKRLNGVIDWDQSIDNRSVRKSKEGCSKCRPDSPSKGIHDAQARESPAIRHLISRRVSRRTRELMLSISRLPSTLAPMESFWSQLGRNTAIWAGVLAWAAAQTIKMALAWRKTREFDFRYFVSTGGMPSAHSAFVCALATSVGIQSGFDSTPFAVALGFAIIVMFDAQSVRRAAGQQARLLNQIVQELFKEHHLSGQKLAELLGHTRLEVFFGMLLGIIAALVVESARSAPW